MSCRLEQKRRMIPVSLEECKGPGLSSPEVLLREELSLVVEEEVEEVVAAAAVRTDPTRCQRFRSKPMVEVEVDPMVVVVFSRAKAVVVEVPREESHRMAAVHKRVEAKRGS